MKPNHQLRGRVVWITGAGSGMGRAAALRAAESGARVVLSGRRAAALAETAVDVRRNGGTALELPLDLHDAGAIREAAGAIRAELGPVTDLVCAAGLNTPARFWRDQDLTDFAAIVQTNLTAVAAVVDTVLPDLRAARGVVVIVSSYAAWRFSPLAGVAYSASKTALGSLSASLNQQEAEHGVRACHLCPGDVDTDFLRLRPEVPGGEARSRMLTADDVARAISFALESPPHVRIDELVLSPVSQT